MSQLLAFDTTNPADNGLGCVFVSLGAVALAKQIGLETKMLRKDAP